MTIIVWPNTVFHTLDRGFWPWVKAFADDFLSHKAQPHPQKFLELSDVDTIDGGLSDGAVFVFDAGTGTLRPVLGTPPALHGWTHGLGGTDPIPGGSAQPLVFD